MPDTAVDSDMWIRRFHPAPRAGHRLVCLPHAGASASYFFGVSRALSPAVEVLAVQYPGRQDRRGEPCVDNVPELADSVAEAVSGWADRPLALFGHSLGATVGFEVARRLEKRGIAVTVLFASGRRAPSRERDETFHLLDDEKLLAEIRGLEGTNANVLADDEIIRMVLPAVRGDYAAAETYRYVPGPDLRAPIRALVGDSDPKVTLEEAEAWGEHTGADFRLKVFPGGHFYLNAHQAAVLRLVTDCLASTSASDTPTRTEVK
ncbi:MULTISPECIES: thioesterase II family protein [unclassified Streptosporangium]|uniref:thioesterase II family protein n=1 Tax=unclassified Streptosporangium TaxID=2632669 RepID=UPI002E2D8319|nr:MULTISPECIES: alpha/beta fold hydrolase [unclassified Streptosporangium]